MPWRMAALPNSVAPTALITALAALAATLLLAAASRRPCTPRRPASGCGVDLEPPRRNVRRGGRVLSGEACGAGSSSAGGGSVKVKLRRNKRWTTVAKGRDGLERRFSACVKVSVPRRVRLARLRATTNGRHRDDRREGDQERPQRLR